MPARGIVEGTARVRHRVERVAFISLHTSPLAQPGAGDSGGMNVYVRELAAALAQTGVECITYVRADRPGLAREVRVEPNHTVVHIEAGPYHLPKEALVDVLDEATAAILADIDSRGGIDVVHAHYWLSGEIGHRIKHTLGVPFVVTFHTLARVKAAAGDREPDYRAYAEATQIGCADAVCVSCPAEADDLLAHHGHPPGEIVTVTPGVQHAFFAPGDRHGARHAVGLDADVPVVLFAGRIQPLKGPDVAIRAVAQMEHTEAHLVMIGGASGADGSAEVARMRGLVNDLDLDGRVHFVDPVPHHVLGTWYRAADVVVVPSRSESFGLVALEAAACGTPVVASAVGGLTSLVDDGRNGFLVPERSPAAFAAALDTVLANPALATSMSMEAALGARAYTWLATGQALHEVYADLSRRAPVNCA